MSIFLSLPFICRLPRPGQYERAQSSTPNRHFTTRSIRSISNRASELQRRFLTYSFFTVPHFAREERTSEFLSQPEHSRRQAYKQTFARPVGDANVSWLSQNSISGFSAHLHSPLPWAFERAVMVRLLLSPNAFRTLHLL